MLTDIGSSNFGSIHVEGVASICNNVFDLTETLIERILCEGALSPHRGNRRRVPIGPMSIELFKFMLFVISMMRMRLRGMLRRLLNNLLFLSLGLHLLSLLAAVLVVVFGLLGKYLVETCFVPNEGILDRGCLSEHNEDYCFPAG